MKKKLFVIMILFFSQLGYAQVDFTAGMGISFVNNSSLQDYINSNFSSGSDLSSFNSSIEVYIEADYSMSSQFQLGLEYVFSIYSYTAEFGGIGQYEFSSIQHKPSMLGYYVIAGPGYKFKFGGGAGLRIADVDEDIIGTKNYSTSGLGLLLRGQAHTLLGGSLFANLGLTLRYDLPGEPENSGVKMRNNVLDEAVNLNSVSFSINLGLSYFL